MNYDPEKMSWEELEEAHQKDRSHWKALVACGAISPEQAQTKWGVVGAPVEGEELTLLSKEI